MGGYYDQTIHRRYSVTLDTMTDCYIFGFDMAESSHENYSSYRNILFLIRKGDKLLFIKSLHSEDMDRYRGHYEDGSSESYGFAIGTIHNDTKKIDVTPFAMSMNGKVTTISMSDVFVEIAEEMNRESHWEGEEEFIENDTIYNFFKGYDVNEVKGSLDKAFVQECLSTHYEDLHKFERQNLEKFIETYLVHDSKEACLDAVEAMLGSVRAGKKVDFDALTTATLEIQLRHNTEQ